MSYFNQIGSNFINDWGFSGLTNLNVANNVLMNTVFIQQEAQSNEDMIQMAQSTNFMAQNAAAIPQTVPPNLFSGAVQNNTNMGFYNQLGTMWGNIFSSVNTNSTPGMWGNMWGNLFSGIFPSMGGFFPAAGTAMRSLTKALPSQYSDLIQKIADEQGSDAKLISCLMHAESRGNKNAISRTGAQGLMQLMPGTAKSMGVTDPFDPEQNIRGGTKYLNILLKKYNGDKRLALAAYNWGGAKVDRAIAKANSTNYDAVAPYIYSGTQVYVANIMQRYNAAS